LNYETNKTTKQQTLKALDKSIKHWKSDVLSSDVIPDADNCPMCKLVLTDIVKGADCDRCIFTDGYDQECGMNDDSYFQQYIRVADGDDYERSKMAIQMIDFMVSLKADVELQIRNENRDAEKHNKAFYNTLRVVVSDAMVDIESQVSTTNVTKLAKNVFDFIKTTPFTYSK
jgi:hypothetical protein